jgi:DNA invertase Pin-like site-specific DNA recombinase
MSQSTLRCAIYTRKSSEEGLEQGFNSLDAQREACEAFVLSQQHEGWKLVPTLYDDGGYSGGNMERPALKKLLTDIDQKKVNVVVVYKVDRLTRSLADFAKIVEQFDAKGISFVSVTQQFNTTSSMGRLTLNVLLSFAQFEREVTGERIRDKIAASKAKGMWMGGMPPVGYRGHERTLVIDPDSAALVNHIFTEYLRLGSVRALKKSLDSSGKLTPQGTSKKSGRTYGGSQFSRGQLYNLLSNPVYIGQIRHKGQVYPGQHPAIISQELWDAVQAQIADNKQGNIQRQSAPSMSLMAGILFDEQGNRLHPSHSQKQSKRFRYYISSTLKSGPRKEAIDGIRVSALEIEVLVINYLKVWLSDHAGLIEHLSPEANEVQALTHRAKSLTSKLSGPLHEQYKVLQLLIVKAELFAEEIKLEINTDQLTNKSSPSIHLTIPAALKRCGHSMRLLVGSAKQSHRHTKDLKLMNGIAKSLEWLNQLTTGKVKSMQEIAEKEGVSSSYVTRSIYRAFLAPDIVRAIMNGTQPAHLTTDFIKRHSPLPLDWKEQRRLLRCAPVVPLN